jgi:protein phosphatase 1 regulatory subunit 11
MSQPSQASSASSRLPGSQQSSQSQTQTETQNPTLVLRSIQAEPADPSEQRHIQWAEDVVDNENMGKKSSKGMSFLNSIWDH